MIVIRLESFFLLKRFQVFYCLIEKEKPNEIGIAYECHF